MEPAKIRRSYISGDTGQIHLRLAGGARTRRPLLCLHFSLLSGGMFETWLAEIGQDRLGIAPDLPGFGMSDPPASPPTVRDYALAMDEVLDALDVTEVDVLGYHLGAKVAVELACLRPRRIKHVVMVGAPVYTPEELAKQRAYVEGLRGAAEDGSHLVAQWQMFWNARGPGQTAEMLMRQFPDALRGWSRRGWGPAAALAYHNPDHIGAVQAPILVLNPNDDLVTYTPRILPHLKNGRVLDLPAWGHGFLELHSTELAAMLRPFLDEEKWPAAARAS